MNECEMEDYVFTFGFGQLHQGCFTVIKAATSMEARQSMNRLYGNQWAFMYESREAAGVKEYGLREIK